jgi:hypothetical protein
MVEVRSLDEILGTLDEQGELDALPFMPEMVQYCGRRMTVYKVATKLCDTITGNIGLRRMHDAVHLTGARCDGSGHDGCQAACLLYWKTAWLRPIRPDEPVTTSTPPVPALLIDATRVEGADGRVERYRCQATEISRAAPERLRSRDVSQYVEDVRTRNVSVAWSLRAFVVAMYNGFQRVSARYLPSWMRVRDGRRWGALPGTVVGATPTERSDLQPGELVRVKSRREVADTLDANMRNRGLGFDAEMGRFCGTTTRVAKRVNHIIDESTGVMIDMKNPCIVLEGVVCEGAYSHSCPRAITPYFREIWLERVEQPDGVSSGVSGDG